MSVIPFLPSLPAITRKGIAVLALACAGATLAMPAAAQAVYRYTGNPFTLFSCGPSIPGPGTVLCSTSAPTNPYTDYIATDAVSATLTLNAALPANRALADVSSLTGFQLSMSDGRHSVSNTDAIGMIAQVATDASGNISQWRLIINTGGLDNGGIATQKWDFVSDSGTLRCCDPTVSGDLARNSNLPGTWASGPPSPAAAVVNLMNMVASPELALSSGQVNSLTDKLNNALVSIQAGQNKQAINQLKAFINSVESAQKNFKMSAQTAARLIAAANAIIATLS